MSKAPSIVLLDVNVWLDNYLPGRPSTADSRLLLDWLNQHGVTITYPITAPTTLFYLIQQAMKQASRIENGSLEQSDAQTINDIAWACIENMADIGAPVGADASDFWLARKYRSIHADLEDNLVLAAAERAQVDYLVTSDKSLLGKSTVPALSPHDFVQVVCCYT